MKTKQANGDGTFTYDNGMIGTRDLPDFINGFRTRATNIGKRIAIVSQDAAASRPSWRAQLAQVYATIKHARA